MNMFTLKLLMIFVDGLIAKLSSRHIYKRPPYLDLLRVRHDHDKEYRSKFTTNSLYYYRKRHKKL